MLLKEERRPQENRSSTRLLLLKGERSMEKKLIFPQESRSSTRLLLLKGERRVEKSLPLSPRTEMTVGKNTFPEENRSPSQFSLKEDRRTGKTQIFPQEK